MTKYYDLNGKLIYSENIRFSRLFKVEQKIVLDSIHYKVKGCAWDGETMYLNIKKDTDKC